ncbi:MAG: hypothetical protein ACI95S_001501, partial [Dinoroseobacter sp.]
GLWTRIMAQYQILTGTAYWLGGFHFGIQGIHIEESI